jgi:hypothetical protein
MSRLRLVGGQVRAQRVAPGGVGERRARHAKDGQLRRQTASQEEVKQRRQRLLLRQVARRAEHNHCRGEARNQRTDARAEQALPPNNSQQGALRAGAALRHTRLSGSRWPPAARP